jgi:hypothetical protein
MVRASNQRIQRERGYLYFLGKDGYVWAAPMKSNPHGHRKRVGMEKINREKGALYFLSKDGYVEKKSR